MNKTDPIEGFWTDSKEGSGIYHYFVEGDDGSLCGQRDLEDMSAARQDRKPGRDDCLKCKDIYLEIHAVKPPGPAPPDWTIQSEVDLHMLLYQGKEQQRGNGPHKLAAFRELEALFNRNGTKPKKSKRARCAADHPNPAGFVAKHAVKSPALPFSEDPIHPKEPTPLEIKTMSAKPKALTPAPVETTTAAVEVRSARLFRRYPVNRTIPEEKIKSLSTSIREVGLLQPITARPQMNPETEEEYLEIIMGTCRWLGCLEIDDDYPVPCFIREMSDKDAARIHSIENFQRNDLDEIDQAKDIAHLRESGWDVEEIMEFLGCKKDFVYRRLALLKLDEAGQQAIRDGNLTVQTAAKVVSLPEEQRAKALKAILNPTRSAKALPQDQALDLLEREFVEPAKKEAEWEERRKVILESFPGAKWNSYEDARKVDAYSSGYVRTDREPNWDLLSDAAREEELVVPTWGELAKKHGAPMVIGCNYSGEACTYVDPNPIIEAEKAACSENPNECIFIHEAAVHQAQQDAERRKLEKEAHQHAVTEEQRKVCDLVLSPEGISKTAMGKIVQMCFVEVCETYREISEVGVALGVDMESDDSDDLTDAAISKYLKSKNFTPLEAMGRLQIAAMVAEAHFNYWLETFFESNALKAAAFPALHKEYEEILAKRRKQEEEEKEREAARAAKSKEEEAAA